MLWIHINNTGVIDCYVNVGNKLRQGNPFDAFVVVDGDYSEGSDNPPIWELAFVNYVKPTAESFVHNGVTEDDDVTQETFELGSPSQANSYFIGGQSYYGKKVHFSSEATSFQGNGGHMAILFAMQRTDGEVERSETLSVFLEPTYGNKNTPLNLNDYNELIQLYKKSVSINLGEISSLSDLDGIKFVDPTPDTPEERPYSFYTFTYQGNPNLLFVGYEDGDTVQQRMEFDSEDNVVVYSYRKTSGDSWEDWTVLYQEPISSVTFTPRTTSGGLRYATMVITTISGQTYAYTIYDGVGIKRIQTVNIAGGKQIQIYTTDGHMNGFNILNGINGGGTAQSLDGGPFSTVGELNVWKNTNITSDVFDNFLDGYYQDEYGKHRITLGYDSGYYILVMNRTTNQFERLSENFIAGSIHVMYNSLDANKLYRHHVTLRTEYGGLSTFLCFDSVSYKSTPYVDSDLVGKFTSSHKVSCTGNIMSSTGVRTGVMACYFALRPVTNLLWLYGTNSGGDNFDCQVQYYSDYVEEIS